MESLFGFKTSVFQQIGDAHVTGKLSVDKHRDLLEAGLALYVAGRWVTAPLADGESFQAFVKAVDTVKRNGMLVLPPAQINPEVVREYGFEAQQEPTPAPAPAMKLPANQVAAAQALNIPVQAAVAVAAEPEVEAEEEVVEETEDAFLAQDETPSPPAPVEDEDVEPFVPSKPSKPRLEFKQPLPRSLEDLREVMTHMLNEGEDPLVLNHIVEYACTAEKLERGVEFIDKIIERWCDVVKRRAPLEDGLDAYLRGVIKSLTGARTKGGAEVVQEIMEICPYGGVRRKYRGLLDKWIGLGLEMSLIYVWENASRADRPLKYLESSMEAEVTCLENKAAKEATKMPEELLKALIKEYMPPESYPNWNVRFEKVFKECQHEGKVDPCAVMLWGWAPYAPDLDIVPYDIDAEVSYWDNDPLRSARGGSIELDKNRPNVWANAVGSKAFGFFENARGSLRNAGFLPAISDAQVEKAFVALITRYFVWIVSKGTFKGMPGWGYLDYGWEVLFNNLMREMRAGGKSLAILQKAKYAIEVSDAAKLEGVEKEHVLDFIQRMLNGEKVKAEEWTQY